MNPNDAEFLKWLQTPSGREWQKATSASLDSGYFILVNGKLKKATFLESAMFFSSKERIIDHTDISEDEFVSTIFLGIAHYSLFSDTIPMLFETMIFGGEYDNRGWRYASYGEAKRSHWEIVEQRRKGEPPEPSVGEKPIFELFKEMMSELLKEENEGEEWKDA